MSTDVSIDGSKLFDMRSAHGFPLEIALDAAKAGGYRVTWLAFVRRAREVGWLDFQTIKVISHALVDCEIEQQVREFTINAIKRFMLENEHPALKEAVCSANLFDSTMSAGVLEPQGPLHHG